MQQDIYASNFLDDNGMPAGGGVVAPGLAIEWQNGPLAVDGVRNEPNGCFVETVIAAALQRIEWYQAGRFACDTNAEAAYHLRLALDALHRRTADREARGVEGTHQQ